jgi:hypothetical protein
VQENPPDLRWRRIKRPVVITGGELTLEMLDLRTTGRQFLPALHIKANGSVSDRRPRAADRQPATCSIVDSTGSSIDYMTLATVKFSVLRRLIIFSVLDRGGGRGVSDVFAQDRHQYPERVVYRDFSLPRSAKIAYDSRRRFPVFQLHDRGKPPRSSTARFAGDRAGVCDSESWM